MKLILQGYSGKMGSIVYEYLKSKNHEFVQLLDRFNQDVSIDELTNCDAIIDFSNPKSSLRLFSYALKYHIPMIIGTTGFSKSELDYIKTESKKSNIGVYVVYNFLSSINVLKKAIKQLSKNSDLIYVTDKHHKSKVDQPSGTSIALVSGINKNKLNFISKRVDFFVYEHVIEINNEFETIEITHRCYNKVGYAKGVEKALSKINTFVGLKTNI